MQSVLLAFALYSRIPVPQAEWSEKNMRYCICCLPLVGVAVGAIQYGVFWLLEAAGAGTFLRGAVLAVLPLLLTGGIHMDGLMDTCDAIHSWKSREERLRILKDPHAGAFAVMGCVVYMLLLTGVWSEACAGLTVTAAGASPAARQEISAVAESDADPQGSPAAGEAAAAQGESTPALGFSGVRQAVFAPGTVSDRRLLLLLCLCFVLSRALSAFAALTIPGARKEGMLHQETASVPAGAVWGMGLLSALLLAAFILLGGLPGLCAAVAAAAVLVYYAHTAMSLFGGTTGDLAGWFLQLCELFTIGTAVLCIAVQKHL